MTQPFRRAAVAILAVAGCLFSQTPSKDKFIKIYLPGGKAITAELAVTDAERERGLMFRQKLTPDQGMLFVFEDEGRFSFWMKNTLIPLDILWLDKGHRIVHIARSVPPCTSDPCPSYTPDRPGSFVLELAAGATEAYGLNLFDRLDFTLPGGR